MRLTALELRVMSALAGRHPQGEIIRWQMQRARVDQRERSDRGFNTFFTLPREGRHLPRRLWRPEDMPCLRVHHPRLPGGATFTLILADGFISCLRADAGDDDWPRDEQNFELESAE
jgi:hypothetical protein